MCVRVCMCVRETLSHTYLCVRKRERVCECVSVCVSVYVCVCVLLCVCVCVCVCESVNVGSFLGLGFQFSNPKRNFRGQFGPCVAFV